MLQMPSFDSLVELTDRYHRALDIVGSQKLSAEIDDLEETASKQSLWEDRVAAREVTLELAKKRALLDRLNEISELLEDAGVYLDLAKEERDSNAMAEFGDVSARLEILISLLETDILMTGEFDSGPAIMTIRSGAGGDDATDFADMLLRMYVRYAEIQSFNSTLLEISHSGGAGIKSASMKFEGPFAYGKLSIEAGTHRLVRNSPFNAAGKRQTSFVGVEVIPYSEDIETIHFSENEIRVDVFRSSGPGGQSVNTTDSAVRITHIPTGIVVSCQNEKSQLQNKLEALRVLQSRLLEMRRQEEEEKKRQLAGDVKASWGEQMRSYVLAPYRMVKDLRTNYEENNPDDVFDGKLEGFISAGIKWRAQQNR